MAPVGRELLVKELWEALPYKIPEPQWIFKPRKPGRCRKDKTKKNLAGCIGIQRRKPEPS